MAADSKQEEFMKYLEKAGVIDLLTKVLVALYESTDRPNNATDFIKEFLGIPSNIDINTLRDNIASLTSELEGKNKEIEELKRSSSTTPSSSIPSPDKPK